jgi:DNA polymerase I
MTQDDPRLFLIDGAALAYRAYFAFIRNPLITRKGEHTSAVFGFLSSLLKLLREEHPTHLAVVWDTPKPTFRHELYKDYKATRAKMPEDMVPQLYRIKEVLELMGIPMMEREGYEADDVIGTIARQAAASGTQAVLVSGDKDYMQLVDDHVIILNPKRAGEPSEWLDAAGVKEKFGVPPEQVTDVLALMGDSSDNVPGVAGVGPKTAVKLITEHGSLAGLYEHLDRVEPKGVREKLDRDRDSALLSHHLVTIDVNVPVQWDLNELSVRPVDVKKIEPLFRELEFTRLLDELRAQTGAGEPSAETPGGEYRTVNTEPDLETVVEAIRRAGTASLDTETTGLNPHTADLVGICLSWQSGSGVYIPIAHVGDDSPQNLSCDTALEHLAPLFADPGVRWAAHHGKYDALILERAGFGRVAVAFDTLLAAYLLDPAGRHSLDALALEVCNHHMIPIDSLIGSGKKQISFAEVPVHKATEYAAEDADFTLRLYEALAPKVREAGLEKLLLEVEQPLVPVLMDMEKAGVKLDLKLLARQSAELQKRLDEIEHDIETLAGYSFNINSTQQLQKVLFEDLKLPTQGKTAKKTGFATGQAVLEELARLHDLPRLVLEYRELAKLKGTYIDALPGQVDAQGRVHTSYNQTVAATGRLSSQDPNLQNIPVRTEVGRQIRAAFVASPGHVLLAADYSQIELRILAHISGDETLCAAFENNEDVHRRTASAVYSVALKDVTAEMRAVAKTANFAIIYGVSAFGLSQQTELSVPEAKEFIDTYFRRYPRVKEYMDGSIRKAREEGFVSTLLGRRRFLPEIHSDNRQRREFAERMAINTPIQGTAADLIKVAMIRIHESMRGMQSRMILQVHDELVFEAFEGELKKLTDLVRREMEAALPLSVPLKVDIGTGANWLDAK